MSGSFYDQLDGVAGVFEQWGECERTVMAVTLARRVPWPGLRLLQRAVEEALARAAPAPDAPIANEEPAVASLLASATGDDDDEGDSSLQKLVELLPLLRSDNVRVKDAYVGAAPALVQRCVDAPRRSAVAPHLCRQLLCYLLVHPALTRSDVRSLTQWLHYLENHISGNRSSENVWQQRIEPCLVAENIWGNTSTFRRTIGKNVEFRSIVDSVDYNSDLLQESFSKNGRDVDISNETEKLNFDATISQPKSQRSNSLTPPSSNFMSSSAENLSDELFVQKPRSFSLSSEHSLQIRPLMMYGTTGGSETRLDDLRCNNFTEHRGMSTVAQWLKSLRLHKYVWLFTNISYDQMMAMDDQKLEELGVTKGARHKILVSIRKLADRAHVVGAVEAELRAGASGATAARALERLRTALLGPMPPDSPLPQAIVQVLHLASKCLNAGGGTGVVRGAGGAGTGDSELDAPDPLSLHCWLVEKALHHEAFSRPDLVEALKRLRHRLPPRQFYRHVGDLPHRHRPKPRWRPGPPQKRWSLGGVHAMPPPQPRPKSHSYPPYPPPPSRHPPGDPADDYSSLDALCLQMTEQAIN